MRTWRDYLIGFAVLGGSLGAGLDYAATHSPLSEDRQAPLFEGMGGYHHPINTHSKVAQQFFNQGLILYYGFDYAESIRSFKEAIRQDPKCAMCYWGLAMALGSISNTPVTGEEHQEAYIASRRAKELVDPNAPLESAYIEALQHRFSEKGKVQPKQHGMECHGTGIATQAERKAFASAMKEVVDKFPQNIEAKNIYAGALFDVAEWRFYDRQGEPGPWTLELVQTLEDALNIDPSNPAANHYYIHVIEQSPFPQRAEKNADLLRNAVPGAEHLVHMPAHIYMLVGRYHDASLANETAIAAYRKYVQACRSQGFDPAVNYLYQHNLNFLAASTAMEGRSKQALEAAEALARATPVQLARKDNLQTFYTVPYFILARFNLWDDILHESRPMVRSFLYQTAMWHYVRGMAYAHQGQLALAEEELSRLKSIAQPSPNEQTMGTFGALQMKIAIEVLTATLADRKDQPAVAIDHWKKAVELQDSQEYTEPPPWYFQTRDGLGDALLQDGKPAEAEAVFLQALNKFPENGWSLFGLERSLRAQNKIQEADAVHQRFKKAWSYADVSLPLK